MSDKTYTLPAAAKSMGISARTLYRYMDIDAKQPQKLKMFPNVIVMEYKKLTHYYFTSSDIRAFNRKYGKPETRKKRVIIRYGGQKDE